MRMTWTKYFLFLIISVVFLAACGQEEAPTPTEQVVVETIATAPA